MTAAAPVTLLWTEIGQRLGLTDTEPRQRQRAVLAAVSTMDWQDLGSAVLPFAPGVAAREVLRHVRQSTSRRVGRVGVGQLDGGDRGCLALVGVQDGPPAAGGSDSGSGSPPRAGEDHGSCRAWTSMWGAPAGTAPTGTSR